MRFLDRQPAVLRSIAVILLLIVSSGLAAPLSGLAAPAGRGSPASTQAVLSASDQASVALETSPHPATQAAPGRPLPFRLGPPRPRQAPPPRPATHTPLQVAGGLAINEFPLPTTPITNPPNGPEGIAAGPDGDLWFNISFSGQIGRATPAGAVTVFNLPNVNAGPIDIARGPDSNLWFAEYGNGNDVFDQFLGRISPTAPYTITQYPAPLLGAENAVTTSIYLQLWGVAAGPDGNVWFTEYNNHAIGRMKTDGTGGVAFSTPLGLTNPTDSPSFQGSYPSEITVGPDGNLWYADEGGDRIGMVPINVTNSSQIQEFVLNSGAGPCGITAGPDGNVWFAEQDGDYIGKISLQPATYGSITYYATPMADTNEMTSALGVLWVTEAVPNRIAKVTVDGSFTEYNIPTAGADPYGIHLGPDGNVWFTENFGNRIGQIVVAGTNVDLNDLYLPVIEH